MRNPPYPKGVVAYLAGNQYGALVLIRVTVHGKGVHGSTPWEGIDPLPPAAEIVSAMGQVYPQMPGYDPLTITIGHIEDVGRFNVIGDTVQLLGTIRSTVEPDMEVARERVKRTAEHVAQAYGATADVEFLQPVPAVHNTKPWIDAVLPTLEHVVGEDNLVKAPTGTRLRRCLGLRQQVRRRLPPARRPRCRITPRRLDGPYPRRPWYRHEPQSPFLRGRLRAGNRRAHTRQRRTRPPHRHHRRRPLTRTRSRL